MTTAAIPARGGRSLLGKIPSFAGGAKAKARISAVLGTARAHMPTIAALSAADLGGFTVFHHGGWFVVAASVFLLDFAVRG